jgi:hypothetical protein
MLHALAAVAIRQIPGLFIGRIVPDRAEAALTCESRRASRSKEQLISWRSICQNCGHSFRIHIMFRKPKLWHARLAAFAVRAVRVRFLLAAILGCFSAVAGGEVHGLWVWKTSSVLEVPRGAENLRVYCQSQGINEAYISISTRDDAAEESRLAHLIDLLHRSNIRVEALLSSEDADEPGKHRDKLLDHVRGVLAFNQSHSKDQFDGIHLDIEPQQRPENKGAGNLRFLPGLADAYRAVLALVEPARLTVNADIQNKLLKGNLDERRMLLTSLPGFTLMLYELSSPTDGDSLEAKAEKLKTTSQKFMTMAYEGLRDPNLAKMVIGLRTPDYGDQLPGMFKVLDEANHADTHYLGWAHHAYNDSLPQR